MVTNLVWLRRNSIGHREKKKLDKKREEKSKHKESNQVVLEKRKLTGIQEKQEKVEPTTDSSKKRGHVVSISKLFM